MDPLERFKQLRQSRVRQGEVKDPYQPEVMAQQQQITPLQPAPEKNPYTSLLNALKTAYYGGDAVMGSDGQYADSPVFNGQYRMTQGFGNYNPALYRGVTKDMRHKGVDFATPTGTKVNAPIAGEIITGTDKNWGNYALLKGDDGVTYRFSHLSNTPTSGRVEPGQLIGITGNSGNSTGPHLDISTQINGQFVDPLSLEVLKRYIGA